MSGKVKPSRWVVAPQHMSGDTATHWYAASGDVKALAHALETGDPTGSAHALYYSPPLHLACAGGHVDCCELLLERGASIGPDIPQRGGRTPLHQAAIGGSAGVASLLIDAGCDVDARDGSGGATPLHAAAFAGHKAVVDVLLAADADASLKARHSGELALHAACRGGHDLIVEALVAHDAGGKAVREFPGVIQQLSQPLTKGSLFTRPRRPALLPAATSKR